MIVEYNDIFYRMIEAFIDIKLPENLLIDNAEQEFDKDLLTEYKSMRREELDYFKANMILIDANYFCDEAFLYFFPMLLKLIFDNDGLLKPLIKRLEKVDTSAFNQNKKSVIANMIDTLNEIDVTTDSKKSQELVTLI